MGEIFCGKELLKDGKSHLINWDICTTPKDNGGLGITKVKDTNFTLLSRWLWHYHHEPYSIWKKIIDAKYNKRFKGDILVDDRYIIQGKQ